MTTSPDGWQRLQIDFLILLSGYYTATQPGALVYVTRSDKKTAGYYIGEDDQGEKDGEEDDEDFDLEDEKAPLTRRSPGSWSSSLLTLLGTRRGHRVPFPCRRSVALPGSHHVPRSRAVIACLFFVLVRAPLFAEYQG